MNHRGVCVCVCVCVCVYIYLRKTILDYRSSSFSPPTLLTTIITTKYCSYIVAYEFVLTTPSAPSHLLPTIPPTHTQRTINQWQKGTKRENKNSKENKPCDFWSILYQNYTYQSCKVTNKQLLANYHKGAVFGVHHPPESKTYLQLQNHKTENRGRVKQDRQGEVSYL